LPSEILQRGLNGTWVPIAADVAGKPLFVGELRVKYFVLESGAYSIIDRTNHVVDSGRYYVNETAQPATLDIVGRAGPSAGRTLLAIFQLDEDSLTVCYDLDGHERPVNMLPREDQLLLSITYERASTALS
jgi:uncharacterized protein (TIGR03067 family)